MRPPGGANVVIHERGLMGPLFVILFGMDEIKLVKPTLEYKHEVLEYRAEFLDDHNVIHGSGGLERFGSYEEWLKACDDGEHSEKVPKDRVPATQFLAIRNSDGKLVGMISVRHSLNEFLKMVGGHIGYSVRESERRKGYATQMLGSALVKCKELGIEQVLITCEPTNPGSAGAIKANGGIYVKQVATEDYGKLDHYRVTIP